MTKVLSHFLEEGRLHLVFELMDHSIDDDIEESHGAGLEAQLLRKYTFQILQGMEYLHNVNVSYQWWKVTKYIYSSTVLKYTFESEFACVYLCISFMSSNYANKILCLRCAP